MGARISALLSLVVAYCVRRWLQDSCGRRAFAFRGPYKLNGGDKCATTATVLQHIDKSEVWRPDDLTKCC
jgi:hypothetical protein